MRGWILIVHLWGSPLTSIGPFSDEYSCRYAQKGIEAAFHPQKTLCLPIDAYVGK